MIERIARRYQGRWLQGYARGKLRSDPVFAAVFDHVKDAPLPLLDVGCGIGLLAFYLRERGFSAPVAGFDFDAAKIAQAQRAADGDRDLRFSLSNTCDVLPGGEPGHVVISDVLHYLDANAQGDLLDRVAERIAPGGLCLIRETPRDRSWRFRLTQIEEAIIHAITWMKSRAVHFPSVEEVCAPFEQRGFSCEVFPLWGRTPLNSHLFVMRRQGEIEKRESGAEEMDAGFVTSRVPVPHGS